MATYNGQRFVHQQLESILEQLEPDDELVVVDDASADGTVDLVQGIGDARIRLFRHERNAGYVRTFEEALTRATGEVLLLSDQDDVWLPRHRDALVEAAFGSGVAASNLTLLDGPGFPGPYGQRQWLLRGRDSLRPRRNLAGVLAGNRPYFGCAMAVHRRVRDLVLPFPGFLDESHDLWIAVCGNVTRGMAHVEEPTVARRLHDANSSSPRPRALPAVLRSRRLVARMILEARRRARTGTTSRARPVEAP
jgi:glycosyltransferase involved in cell wall biosynthesis